MFLFLLAFALAAPIVRAGDLDAGSGRMLTSPRRMEPTYRVQVGMDGEIFPAFANYASLQKPQDRRWPTVTITISNPTDAVVRNRVAVQVPGWSDQEIQMAETAAGAARKLQFAPTFLPRLYANREIAGATVSITVSDSAGRTVFATTQPVRLRAAEDMYWGKDFEYAQFIASWVTPHDRRVEQVLSQAKELAPNRTSSRLRRVGRTRSCSPDPPICRPKRFIRRCRKRGSRTSRVRRPWAATPM